MLRRAVHVLPALALLLGAASRPPSPAEILAQMRSRQAELTSLRARLVQTKIYPQLGIEDPAERGVIYIERGRRGVRVRIEIEEPEGRILIVRDGSYLLYQPRIRQAVEGKLAGARAKGLFSGVLMGSPEALDELESGYHVEAAGGAKTEGAAHHLRFTARPGADAYCRDIELFVDPELLLPVRQSCREANGSLVTFSLSELEVDVPFPRGLFDVELPPGVERVKG